MSDMQGTPQDHAWMRYALELAEQGGLDVEPNPLVGAVIVRDNEAVGHGWHCKFGGPHAEVEAITSAREKGISLEDTTCYVTLEPCCHHGKTPPCTNTLIESGVARVVVATEDPFAEVAGKGIAQLREAGIEVEVGLMQDEAQQLNDVFFKRQETGLPWVFAKWAQTVDGRVATASGHSKWISNENSRSHVHKLRKYSSAIMVGIGTALADNPMLTARNVDAATQSRRVVIDPDLRLPANCKLVESIAEAPLTVATREGAAADRIAALQSLGVEIVRLPSSSEGAAVANHLAIEPLLKHLADTHAAHRIMIEGGPRLIGTMLAQQLIDQAVVFVAPKLLGDAAAHSAVFGQSCESMADAIEMQLRNVETFDADVMLDYRLRYR